MDSVTYKQVMDHIEVYDKSGNFLFSADTIDEAEKELALMDNEIREAS